MEAVVIWILLIPIILVAVILGGVVKGNNIRKENLEVRNQVEERLREKNFNIEKRVGLAATLYVDNTQKLWAVNEWNNRTDIKIYKYSDLIDFELIEDNESLMKGGFGKALVGGAIGGTKGAIIGSAGSRQIKQNATLLEIKIRTNDFENPQYSIQFIKGFSLPKSSPEYRKFFDEAQQVIGLLNYISTNGSDAENNEDKSNRMTITEQLRELNQLKDEGIITLEEFELKKKELLNL